MNFTDSKIAEYAESFTSEESGLIQRLLEVSVEKMEHVDMLSGRQVGMLLRLLVQISGAKRVLDIGTFTGYSAMMMADVLPEDGELITIEFNEHYRQVSDLFLSEPPFDKRIYQIMGNALEIIPRMEGDFDLIFLDADKINYPKYFQVCKTKLRKGGLFVIDNVLWGGKVIDQSDEKAKAVHKMNEMIREDPQTEQVILPVRDGITILRLK